MSKIFLFFKSKVVLLTLLGIVTSSAIIIPVVLANHHSSADDGWEWKTFARGPSGSGQLTWKKADYCYIYIPVATDYLYFEKDGWDQPDAKNSYNDWWTSGVNEIDLLLYIPYFSSTAYCSEASWNKPTPPTPALKTLNFLHNPIIIRPEDQT
jgi:hypothetical protein